MARSLTGHWSGEYAYPRHKGPTTPFLATIEERGGQLTGTIIEPDMNGGATIAATIRGVRHGHGVDFTKQYGPAASPIYGNPVDYVGRLSADGLVITGVWSLLDMDGTFEMRRETAMDEPVQEREAVPVMLEPVESLRPG